MMHDMARTASKAGPPDRLRKTYGARLSGWMRRTAARSLFAIVMTVAPAAVMAQQVCTPGNVAQNATDIQLFDSAGNERVGNNQNLSPGDLVVYRNAIVADYNSNALVDVVYEIVDIVVPPEGSARLNSASGELELRSIAPPEDAYMTFRVLAFLGGTFTNNVASGEPADLVNATVSLQDIDSNLNQNFSDVGGILRSSPSSPSSISLSNTEPLPFQNGGGPANFDTFLATPQPPNSSPPDFTAVPNTTNFPLFSANFNFAEFTDATFLHGVTGSRPNRLGGRGATLAICGTIPAPELEFEKTTLAEVENANGTTDVSYRLTFRNTGEQDLDLLSLTDDVDAIFSSPVDVFLPSTIADPSGGIFALDPESTTVTDVGPTLIPIATNPDFDGGSDIEILAQPTTSVLTPGDEAFVDVTIRIFLNDQDEPVSFINVANLTVLDEFNLPLQITGPAPPVSAPARPSRIALVKSVTSVEDTNGTGAFGDAGDTVNYVFTVENTGQTSLAQVTVTDTGIPGVSAIPVPGFDGDLAGGEGPVVAATASVVLQDADITAGAIVNTAIATAQPVATGPDGQPDPTIVLVNPGTGVPYEADAIRDDSDAGTTPDLNFADGTVPPIGNPAGSDGDDDPTILILPEPPVANPDSDDGFTPGEVATLPDITANDQDDGTVQPDRVSLVAPAGATELTDADGDVISVTVPGEGVWAVDEAGNVTFTPEAGFELDPTPIFYTVLDDDGFRSNEAQLSVLYDPLPGIALTKTADASALSTPPMVGDVITYTYEVSNTGNVILFDVTVSESALGFTGNGDLPDPVFQTGGEDLDGEGDDNDLAPGTDTLVFEATYIVTQADIDQGEVVNSALATGDNVTGTPVTDVSDDPEDGTDDLDNGDPADPTVVPLAQMPSLTLTKSVTSVPDTNGDGLFGGEGDVIAYSFLIVNSGNVTLTDVSIEDPLFDVLPVGATVTLEPGMGDNTTFTGAYMITPDNVADGFVVNQAVATGTAPDDTIVMDVSDTGTDSNADTILAPETVETPDQDGNLNQDPTNDPTVQSIPAAPRAGLQVTKSVAEVRDENGNGLIDAGDVVVFSFTITNTGNLALADIVLTDNLANVTGSLPTLAVMETNTDAFTAEYTVDAADVVAGVIENSATATGGAVNSLGDPISDPDTGEQVMASDVSDAGTEPDLANGGTPVALATPEATETPDANGQTDGDPRNDPTLLNLPQPGISLIKSVSNVADTNGDGLIGGPQDIITYSFTITNTGDIDLGNILVSDDTAVVSGGPISLAAGASDSTSITATYVVTQDDIANGFVQNTATVDAAGVDDDGAPLLGLGGVPITISDVSDTGTDQMAEAIDDPESVETEDGNGITDGDPTNDPTVTSVSLNPEPGISLIKSATAAEDTNNDGVAGAFDDLLTYTFDVTNTGNFALSDVEVTDPRLGGLIGTIARLEVGETQTLTFDYLITFEDFTAGEIENSATASGQLINSAGTPILDGDTGQPITVTDVSDTGSAQDLSSIDDPEGVETADLGGGTDGDSTNDPTVTSLQIVPSNASVSGFFFQDGNGNGVLDQGIDTLLPGIIVNLLDGQGRIVGSAVTNENGFYEISGFPTGPGFTIEFRDPQSNEVLDTVEDLDFGPNTVLTDQNGFIEVLLDANLVLVKSTTRDTVILGDSVPYIIAVTNNGAGPARDITVTDTLPAGMGFIPGTATVDGVEVEPTISGRTQTFENISVDPGQTVEIRLIATVLPNAPFGDLTNVGRAFDPVTGEELSSNTATVERLPEAIFDCSDVIGKVFDDRNFNGYQDPPPSERAGITDQNIFDGKFAAPTPTPQGEPGLSNVRLVTATGTIITTDEFGRYSVPCAELAGPIGTNFTLKIDTNSLPTGYRVTTENPRTMRLTAGIATEMNFGAAIGRVLDVDLTSDAFDGEVPVERLQTGLITLLRQIKDTPSVVRISYFTRGETTAQAGGRIDAVEDLLERQWRGIGRYKLIVETTIKRLQ